ncbi:MAG: Hsp33 family molecular chaperone HslO [Eubacteriales bacterium]|nr:Hsp33 family molecular chaperone HslO [Eubacteriales bacterium]
MENKEFTGDYIVRAIAADGMIRAFAATTRELVETARVKHGTSPVCTAALGRLLTAGSMMGTMLKGDGDLLTLTVRGDGPMQGVSVTADAKGRVKGFVYNPDVWNKEKRPGKLDVGGAVGQGTLTVVRDQDFGEPYSSQVQLVNGEIGEDLTSYFATSEQIPSGVGLGVLVNTDQTVAQAGGFIVQLMPGFSDEVLDKLEDRLLSVHSVTELLEKGMTPEEILEMLLGDMDLEFTDKIPAEFYCNCSKERVARVLISLGSKELKSMIEEGKDEEVVCQHCNRKYTFTVDELQTILMQARAARMQNLGILSAEDMQEMKENQ